MFSCSGSGFSFICIGREQLLIFSLFVAIGAIFGVSTDHILIFLILMRFHSLWYLHFVFYRSLFKPVTAISTFPQMELLIEQ